ncbi:MAG: ankyrin repeat domain-containing protein [Gemmatimonadaceae bacterium]|nr:ankyrin repeat domain-containing protein [Gemmatimonadaceae bacterium]
MNQLPFPPDADVGCDVVLGHLREGSFTILAPVVTSAGHTDSRMVQLYRDGCFAGHAAALAEALTCAAFVGAVETVEYLIGAGVPPDGGRSTGLNAMHWAANRGQTAVVLVLIGAGAALEARNAYGGTVLGAAVWAAVHETKPGHMAVIQSLLEAGAEVREAEYPCGDPAVDALLASFGARVA